MSGVGCDTAEELIIRGAEQVGVCACSVVNPCVLSGLPYNDQRKVVRRLPTSLPLHISARYIDDDDDYWKRCCRARWRTADVKQHAGSWKQMVMEKTMESIIENYVPVPAQCSRLQAIIPLASSIVRRLKIGQLLPPVKVVPDSDTGDYLVLSDTDSTHFDFGQILPQVSDMRPSWLLLVVLVLSLQLLVSLSDFYYLDCCVARYQGERGRYPPVLVSFNKLIKLTMQTNGPQVNHSMRCACELKCSLLAVYWLLQCLTSTT